MDAKQAIEALKNATPEQREAIRQTARKTTMEGILKRSGLEFASINGTWVLAGSPEQWIAFFDKYNTD